MDFIALMLLLMLAGVIISAGFVIVAAMRHDWSTDGMPFVGGVTFVVAGIATLVALMLFTLALPGDKPPLAPLITRSLRIAAITLLVLAMAIFAIIAMKGDDWMELDWRRRRAFLIVLVVTFIGGFVGLNILHKS